MQKEMLKKYLADQLLMDIIEHKAAIDTVEKRIRDALVTLHEVCGGATAGDELEVHLKRYQAVSKGYSNMLEDAFSITWQNASIIKKYAGCSDAELDRLPETLKP